MGDIADEEIDAGIEMYYDHTHGHHCFRPEDCPYCAEEDEDDEE